MGSLTLLDAPFAAIEVEVFPMPYQTTLKKKKFRFKDLKTLLASASPDRAADHLAEVSAGSELEGVAAEISLADVQLKAFLTETFVPYEEDEVTRLIIDTHDAASFEQISHLTVGEFREWLLNYQTDSLLLD